MAIKTAKQTNPWYIQAAQRLLKIDETDEGQLYCLVPSESNVTASEDGKWYRVDVDQSLLVPHASSCQCKHFEMHHDCKHCTIVNKMYQRIYKSNVLKAETKQSTVSTENTATIETSNASSSNIEEIAEEIGVPVEEVEAIKAIAIEHKAAMTPKDTELCRPIGPRDTKRDWTKTALTRNDGFTILKKVS